MMTSRQLIANCFQIQDLLGRGARSVGEVYCAVDTQTGEIVAFKAPDLQVAFVKVTWE